MSYRVALIADNHFLKCGNAVYVNGTYTKQYLKRFTSNFDELLVIARVKNSEKKEIKNLRESGGERVEFCSLPDFYGVGNYLKQKKKLKELMLKGLEDVDAIFVRMPCILTTLAFECAKTKHLPIMIDVGADPDNIYRGARTTLFELAISKYMMNVCKKNCMTANGVSYVTRDVLQRKYPCKAIKVGESVEYFTASISNADISGSFYEKSRDYSDISLNGVKLLHISNNICANSGKGHMECIEVLKELVKSRINASITFVGGGDGIDDIKMLAEKYGLKDKVQFMGRIADRDKYKSVIMQHDIFLFPSHSEGLPRVLLETMATGIVCISSNVDGIPEILDKDDIFNYSDSFGMAERIKMLIEKPELMNQISLKNLEVSKKYSNENLKIEYDKYYGKVRKLIEQKRRMR